MAFAVSLLLIAATVALTLGAVGTFGVISYLVAQRTSEIGVRMAIGASSAQVRRMVLLEGLKVTLGGIVVGLLGAALVTRLLESQLFEVSPLDPLTFATVPAVLALVAIVACWLPAYRAAKLEPVIALRHE